MFNKSLTTNVKLQNHFKSGNLYFYLIKLVENFEFCKIKQYSSSFELFSMRPFSPKSFGHSVFRIKYLFMELEKGK